jgi:diguanylate cyclase (GGDEF)-like protein
VDKTLKSELEICDVPTEHEFAANMVITSMIILIIAVGIAASVTWMTTRQYDPQIHTQAMRTAILLPLIIVPICTSIVGLQGWLNHRRMLHVSRLARTDEMTGLANRRAFTHAAEAAFQTQDFDYAGLSLFIVDLDHFKQVNDVYGHDAGDKVLIHASRQIASALPENSFVARLGGEEFGILMPFTTVAELKHSAEAIRQRVAAAPCNYDGQSIAISASIGVGIAHARDSISSVLCRADNALYEAKDQGRDRIVVTA